MDVQPSSKEKRPLPEVFRDAWSQALGAVSSAEDEAQRALARVSELAGWTPDELRRQVRDFANRLAGQRDELEKGVEQGVQRALARVKLPRREDVDALRARVEKLTTRVSALAKTQEAGR